MTPGHGPSLQTIWSVYLPAQFFLLTGDGLVHALSLVLTPSEHETEQLVQLRHSEKFPSTTKLKINNKFKRLRIALPLTTPPLTLLVIPK